MQGLDVLIGSVTPVDALKEPIDTLKNGLVIKSQAGSRMSYEIKDLFYILLFTLATELEVSACALLKSITVKEQLCPYSFGGAQSAGRPVWLANSSDHFHQLWSLE